MTEYCPNCMEPISTGQTCPHCGAGREQCAHIAQHLPAGTVLANGRYLVGRALGQGGFGITYIARDLTLDMRVAIKEYFPTLYVSRNGDDAHALVALSQKAQERFESGRRRFLDEARVLAKFHGSPGIVDVRDFFEQNETAYIVMDYLEGETLKEHLKHETIEADRAFELMQPILDALELIHADQVIHRDISPDNIMMCNDGEMCLMDFGAAHELDCSDQRTVTMVLKAGYAPEEQYRAKGELGPWTDIYALCATMYRAITGVAPDESLQRLISDEMLWPSDMGIRISPAQEAVLKKGMASRSAERYHSIAEMKADYAAKREGSAPASEGPSGQGSGSAAAAQGKEPRRRKRGKVAAVLAALCVALAVAAFFLMSPAFTVSFDAAGGGSIEPVTVSRIGEVDEPPVPARKDYEFVGWYLDDDLNEAATFPLKVGSDTTLYAAWEKTRASYRVDYLDAMNESPVADSKTVEGAEVGSQITEKAPSIDGYAVDGDKRVKLVISEDDAENVMAFRFRKRVPYEVRYLEAGSDSEVSPAKSVDDALEGIEVREAAPEVPGYTLQSEREQSLTPVRDADENAIVFYYEPVPVQTVDYGTYTGGSTRGGGSSKSGSGSGSSKSNDVEWAN